MQYLNDESPDVLLLTETWFPEAIVNKCDPFSAQLKELMSLEDVHFNIVSKERENGRRGGGVAIIYKSNLPVKLHQQVVPNTFASFEFIEVLVKTAQPFLLACIYRPGTSSSVSEFLVDLTQFFHYHSTSLYPLIIAGDWNIKLNWSQSTDTLNFKQLLFEHGFTVLSPEEPTHIAGSIIDFPVISRNLQPNFISLNVMSSWQISDHFPVSLKIRFPRSQKPPLVMPKKYRCFKDTTPENVNNCICIMLSSLDYSSWDSLDVYLKNYNYKLTELLNTIAPFRVGSTPHRKRPPWMDAEYVEARALRRRYQRTGDKDGYNRQRRHCSHLAFVKHKAWACREVEEASDDPQQLFKVLNRLLDKDQQSPQLPDHTDPIILANDFNNFFVNKINAIRSSLPQSNSCESPISLINNNTTPPVSSLDSFELTTREELLSIIKKTGTKTSPADPLPSPLIESNLDALLPHLENLVNLSLSTSSFEGLKEAYVVPLLKGSNLDPNNMKNYRPVSLLPFVGKLIERVVHNRVTSHLALNNLNCETQHGYKKHHSCETLLVKLIDDIMVAVDQGRGVVVLIVDLSAAFDTVDHKILLNVLRYKYFITGSALKWFKSFLTGRTQRVKIGDHFSEPIMVSFGVPQGSVLGPLLFNMYTAAITREFFEEGFESLGYADDNVGYMHFTLTTQIRTLMNSIPDCISRLKRWTSTYFLKLNEEKTSVIVFGNQSFTNSLTVRHAHLNSGDILKVDDKVKLLGVTLDSGLTFDNHISKVISSANLILHNIRKIRRYLDRKSAETLVHALITSRLDQCNLLLLGTSTANRRKLQLLQNNALRVTLDLHPRSRLSTFYQELHWLNIDQRLHFKLIITVHKCINNSWTPAPLANRIVVSTPHNMVLDTPFHPESQMGKKAFRYLGPRCWNALPNYLRVTPEFPKFKGLLKNYLFNNYQEFLHNVDPYTTPVIGSL